MTNIPRPFVRSGVPVFFVVLFALMTGCQGKDRVSLVLADQQEVVVMVCGESVDLTVYNDGAFPLYAEIQSESSTEYNLRLRGGTNMKRTLPDESTVTVRNGAGESADVRFEVRRGVVGRVDIQTLTEPTRGGSR